MNKEYPTNESWGQRLEQEELDRSYYEQLDSKEKAAGLQSALEIVTRQNADLKAQLQDGRRVVGEYMGTERDRTDQINHLAAQVVRLQKENEEWKTSHATLMELNKSCAQSNVDLHEQNSALKYKADFNHKDMVKKLAEWIDVNTILKKENEDLKIDKQILEHFRARNVELEAVKESLERQVIKLQRTEMAHRKIIDFYNTAGEILSKTLGILQDLSVFEGRRKRLLIKNSLNSVQAIQANIDHELENLREGKTVKVQIGNPS